MQVLITWSCIRSPGQSHQRISDPETACAEMRDIGIHLTAVLYYDRFALGGNMPSQSLVEGKPQLSLGGCVHLPDLLPVHLPRDAKDPGVQLHCLLVNEEQGGTIRLNQLESLMHHLDGRVLRNFCDLHYQGVHADLVLKYGGHHRDEEVSKKPT